MEAELMKVNPLMDFARKVECSVKLPSQGLLYDEDMIEFNSIGEVNVMPMLPNDELAIVNPEALISGDAVIGIIKSCCSTIHRPEELYYPDVNALLLAIRKATYGDELIQTGVCPKCWEKKANLEEIEIRKYLKENKINENDLNEDEKYSIYKKISEGMATQFTEMEKENKIKVTPVEYKYSIDEILQTMSVLPKETIIETKEGLKIYLTPYKCRDKILFSQRNINEQKMLKYYQKSLKDEELTNENMQDYLSKTNRMLNMYTDISNKSLDIISTCINKIVLPNGSVVSDQNYIDEYIKNVSSDLIVKLSNKIEELNNYGIKHTLSMECPCCGNKWEEKFYGFNQSDFFGISS